MPARWKKHNRPLSRAAFAKRFPDDRACTAPGGAALAEGLRLPSLRRPEGLGALRQEVHLGMRRVRAADLGDGRDGDAPEQVAADDLVHGDPPRQQPFERHLCAAAPGPTRARLLQDRLADAAQATPRHGSIPIARNWPIWLRPTRPRSRTGPRMIRSAAARVGATSASCWSLARLSCPRRGSQGVSDWNR